MNAIPGTPVPDARYLLSSERVSRYRKKSGLLLERTDLHAPEGISLRLEPRFLPVGDTGISVQFGTEIDPALNEAVAALDQAISAADLPGIVETVPSFRSLLVVFEPAAVDGTALVAQLRALCGRASRRRRQAGRCWNLPVVYDPYGEDLAEVAGLLGMPERNVVAAHVAAEFRVYMLGFQPGLPNLGGLPPELQVSRRTSPRKPVPAGSVMIGGVQGAIMPLPTPTGLYMVGRTPVRLFDRRRPEPGLLRPGDTVRFRRICPAEFAAVSDAVASGELDAGALLDAAEAA
jgi:KipI family sensor histidine kinase inhibitor